jgi:hypothetical protein
VGREDRGDLREDRPCSIRTRRVAGSSISIAFIGGKSMTMPPSFVERPLKSWPPLRIGNATD